MTVVQQLGDIVQFTVSLGGVGAILGRFLADWYWRDARDPHRLAQLGAAARQLQTDRRGYAVWTKTVSGALFGLLAAGLPFLADAT